MLVLSRKLNESICVGEDIRVTVVKLGRGRVGLSIDAPQECTIMRKEIADQQAAADPAVVSDVEIRRRVHELGGFLRKYAVRHSTEELMQQDVQSILEMERVVHRREVALNERDRIDFLTDDGIGIECKVRGSQSMVLRQLLRYSVNTEVKALILVTSRKSMIVDVQDLGQKPFDSVWIAGCL